MAWTRSCRAFSMKWPFLPPRAFGLALPVNVSNSSVGNRLSCERVETSDNSAGRFGRDFHARHALPAPDPVERTSRRPVRLGLSRVR